MARRKKIEKRDPTRTEQIRLADIASKLGTNVNDLLESYGDPKTIIDKFDSGDLRLIVEEDEE